MGVRGDHRQLRQQADGGEFDLLGIVDAQRVLVEGRQGGHRTRQHRHRVGVVRERVEEAAQVLVQQGVTAHAVLEGTQLGGRRQFTVDEQPRHLEVGGVRGDILDRVAAVAQDAGVAVDVGDRALGGGGVHETVVEGRVPGLLHQRGDVDARRTVRALPDRELRSAAGEGEGRLVSVRSGGVGHVYSLIGSGVDSCTCQ